MVITRDTHDGDTKDPTVQYCKIWSYGQNLSSTSGQAQLTARAQYFFQNWTIGFLLPLGTTLLPLPLGLDQRLSRPSSIFMNTRFQNSSLPFLMGRPIPSFQLSWGRSLSNSLKEYFEFFPWGVIIFSVDRMYNRCTHHSLFWKRLMFSLFHLCWDAFQPAASYLFWRQKISGAISSLYLEIKFEITVEKAYE